MKRIYSFMFAAVAAFAAASCAQELDNQLPEGEKVVFEASVDGADTKVTLDGKVSKWESGDKITIHNGTKGYEFATTDEGVKANFSYTGDDFSGDKFMAVYPAGEYTADVAAKTVTANIPTYQPSRENDFSVGAVPSVAYAENNSLAFKNASALLKFTVKGTNVKGLVFYGNNNEAVSGNIKVSLDEDNAVESVEALETTITENDVTETKLITWAKVWAQTDNWCFNEGVTYYLSVVPQNFEKGFAVELEIDGGSLVKVKNLETAYDLKPNTILNLGELEYVAPVVSTVEKVYLKPGVWVSDNAWFSAHFWGAEDADVKMTDEDNDGIYEAAVPAGSTGVIFCRMNPEYTEFGWDVWEGETEVENHVWNQTEDLTVPVPTDDKLCYVVKGWDSYEWQTLEDATTAVTPEEKEWNIVGLNGDWNTNIPMTLVDGWYVAENVTIKTTDGFKFRVGTAWDDVVTYTATTIDADTEYATVDGQGVDNEMKVSVSAIYSVYLSADASKMKIVKTGDIQVGEPEDPEVTEPGQTSEWAMFRDWDGSGNWTDKYFVTTSEANVVVVEDVTMEAAQGFLVRKPATEWTDKYGAGEVNYIKANHYITTVKDGGDMCLETSGTYDVYFNTSTKNIYVMTAGQDYTTATEQTVNGEEPKQEEPEVTEKVVYLKPNANWTQANARFAAYFWKDSSVNTWVSMTAVGDGTYEAHLPQGYDYGCSIIFCRMDPGTSTNNWNNKWNQTSDLTVPTDGTNLYTVAAGTWDNGGGTWSTK